MPAEGCSFFNFVKNKFTVTARDKSFEDGVTVFCFNFTNFTLILQNHANGFYFTGLCYRHSQKTTNKS